MKKQKLKQVIEEELQKLLNEREKHVGRQWIVQSTPGTGAESTTTIPGTRTIKRGPTVRPTISPDSEIAAMNPNLAVPSQEFIQTEPMTFNVTRGRSPKEVTIQPPSVRVSGRPEPKRGWEGARNRTSWYDTYFGEPQQELVSNIIGGIGDYARKGYEALGLPQAPLSWEEQQAQKQIALGAARSGRWLSKQVKHGQDAPGDAYYEASSEEDLRKKRAGLTTTGEYRLGLAAEGWEQVTNVLDAISMVIPGGLVKKALRPEDIIRIGDDIVMGKIDDSLYSAMETALKRKKMPATKQDVYERIVDWLDDPYNAVGADEMSRATFDYAQSIDPDYDIPMSMRQAEEGAPLAAGVKDAIEKERIQQRVQGRLQHGQPSKHGKQTELGGAREHPAGRVPAEKPHTVVGAKPGEEMLGTTGTAGKRMSDIKVDSPYGESGHAGVDRYSDLFNELDQAGDVYLANPYFVQNAENALRVAAGEAPLPLDPSKALNQTMNRHQFIRITGRRDGAPDIILNRIITRGPDGKDIVTHSGFMTPNAYNINRRKGMLAGQGRKGKLPGLDPEDMAVALPDGSLIAGRAGNRRVLRGPQSHPELAGGGIIYEPLQERKQHFKLRIKRKR